METTCLDSSLQRFYESLHTPVFFCKDDRIVWNNPAAKTLVKNRSFCMALLSAVFPIQEKTFSLTDRDLVYTLCLRPAEGGAFVEIHNSHPFLMSCDIPGGLQAADSLNSLARVATHCIFQSVDTLQTLPTEPESREHQKYLTDIEQHTYRVLRATNLYEEYTRLQSSDHPKKYTVDLYRELSILLDSVQLFLRRCDTTFSCPNFNENILFCQVNIHELATSLLHLICNAFTFCSSENEVRFDFRYVDRRELQFSVYNQGSTLSPERIDLAPKPFYSYNPLTDAREGCGLGLSYACLFAKKNGGSCTISSSASCTTVVLSIPFTPPDKTSHSIHTCHLEYRSDLFSDTAIILSPLLQK